MRAVGDGLDAGRIVLGGMASGRPPTLLTEAAGQPNPARASVGNRPTDGGGQKL